MKSYFDLNKLNCHCSKYKTILIIVVVIHYLLSVLGAIGSFNPFVYLFYNFVVIFLLIWSIYGKNDEPLKLAIVINMCSIILDALYIVALADDLSGFRNSLSAAASLIHLIFRPFSILLLIKKEEKRNIPIDTVCSRESG
ncbi:uncharacterized protein LOC130896407 isoform X3 [Diorhabda carinulata]|uniref:uncharacterized protein LOC130896407 isoform X3 n=1 Tax=Diorhabda carinulata TaxID=1163345 RepID=UPI0025A03E56|nr:uncharacterized protein LOC130896407 isoform X3 [Diorhabda carinulata]